MPATRIDPNYLYPSNEDGAAASLPTFYAELIAAINEHADNIDAGGGDGVPVTNYGAVGDGTTPDSDAILAGIEAAEADPSQTLYFPPGEYLLDAEIAVATDRIKFRGRNATIRYASTVRRAMVFADGLERVIVDGLDFEGDDNDDYTVNQYAALYFSGSNTDIDVRSCVFTKCQPLTFASDDTNTGRLYFGGCRVLEAPNGLSVPSHALIVDSWFINDEVIDTRAQAIYPFGAAEDVIIGRCRFINIAGPDIQFRAGSSRWQQKRSVQIGGCYFEGSAGYSIYDGSDDTVNVGGANIVGNIFRNVASTVSLQGCRDSIFAHNNAAWDWEYAGTLGIANSAIVVSHGGPTLSGHLNPSTNVRIEGNLLVQRHPWFGLVDFASIPTAGETITVGAVTYTWVAGASGDEEVTIGGTIQACIEELMNEIRGYGATAQNAVIRDTTDVFYNEYTANGAINTRLVIVSHGDFALSEVSASMTVTAPVHNATSCPSPLSVMAAQWPVIESNTFVDFPSVASVQNSVAPTIARNKFTGTALFANANAYSVIRHNRFTPTAASDSRSLLPQRLLGCTDGFPVLEGNGLTCEQERSTTELGGSVGTVTIGSGQSRVFLYYGAELTTDPQEPHCIPFSWSDGDTVQIFDEAAVTHTWTFKRDTPGALEFNSAASLIALINATGTLVANFASFYDAGSTPDPELMIEIKTLTPGTAGDACALWVTTRSLTCGLILRNRLAAEDMSWFRGGSAITSGTGTEMDPYIGATKTWVFTPLGGTTSAVHVQGVDSDSHDLAPRVYPADAIPGVGFPITSDASVTADEQFVYHVSTT